MVHIRLSILLLFLPLLTISQNIINENHKLNLNGVEQWVYVKGRSDAPILLVVHGGPGHTLMGHYNTIFKELEKDYLIVMWDQPGTAKSYSCKLQDSIFTINSFKEFTISLTKRIVDIYKRDQVYLLGFSWGTIPATLAVQQSPSLYKGYIGVSQVVQPSKAEVEAYGFVLDTIKKGNDATAINKLTQLGEPPYKGGSGIEEFSELRKYLQEYGGIVHNYSSFALATANICYPEYNSFDKWKRVKKGKSQSLSKMWDELMEIKLDLAMITIPVVCIQGKYDKVTPVEYLYESISANKIIEVESGHYPMIETREQFYSIIKDFCKD